MNPSSIQAILRERTLRYRLLPGPLTTLLFLTPLSGLAQSSDRHELDAAQWVNDASLLAINSVISGLVAGTRNAIRGGAFWSAARKGAAGGALIYGGKRIAGLDVPGALWSARLLAATGISVVDNASLGLRALERLYVPVGPVSLEVDRAGGDASLNLSVNVRDLVGIAEAIYESDLAFNWGQSLASATPVFDANNRFLLDHGVDGRARGGIAMIEASEPLLLSAHPHP